MTERWLPVVGYEGSYEVSDMGRVRALRRLDSIGRLRNAKTLSPRKGRRGHLVVALYSRAVRRDAQVHHLVLEAFTGPRPSGLEGCHWDDDPANNRPDNLRWDTRASNAQDCVRNGGHVMANRTRCPEGHTYTPENTYVYPTGSRACRQCRRDYQETHREERREKNRAYMRDRRAALRVERKVA